MAKVSVLYIRDNIVAPHLELLRNICEPSSKAKPHVTVRFFKKLAISPRYLKATVDHVDLLAPGAFLDADPSRDNRTVFIRCQADDLLSLEHKPLFPTSEFHITLYDGVSEPFAKKLFSVLEKYHWAFRLTLPELSALTTIEIKPKNARRPINKKEREYAPLVMELFKKIFDNTLTEEFIFSLSDRKKLDYADKICAHLHKLVDGYETVQVPKSHGIEGLDRFPEEKYDIHLTPPELAQDIASYALKFLPSKKIDFGDPAVGTGAFYAALLQILDKHSINSSVGIDISSKQVAAAKWRWKSKDMEVREGDFLLMEDLPPRNLILANPPYHRHQGMKSEYKQLLRNQASLSLGMPVSARSGQYVYFLLFSHKWMAPGAIAAWLIPSEFMQTDYGKALRYYFSRTVSLIRIHQFDAASPQFENAEVLPCVVVFKNEKPVSGKKAIFSLGGTLMAPASSEKINLENLEPSAKWAIKRHPIVERDDSFVRLGDIFSVKRGIATGANSFFVMDRERARELEIPEIALKPLLPKAMNLGTDIIGRKRDGYPNIERQMCVLDCSLPEAEIAGKYPKLMNYLNIGKQDGIRSGYLVSRRSPWYKQEQREPALFLCTYMGKAHGDKPAIRFIWNKSDAIATNTYLLLYPLPNVEKLFKRTPSLKAEVFEALKASSWNSMHEFSRSHAGGLSKIEPKELEEVWLGPLPDSIIEVLNRRLI